MARAAACRCTPGTHVKAMLGLLCLVMQSTCSLYATLLALYAAVTPAAPMLCMYVHGRMQNLLQHLWHTSTCAPATFDFASQLIMSQGTHLCLSVRMLRQVSSKCANLFKLLCVCFCAMQHKAPHMPKSKKPQTNPEHLVTWHSL